MPRPRSSRISYLFIAGVLLFLATIFTGIGGSLFLTEQRYRQQGVRTQALVTGKVMRPATADTSTVYEITYTFTPSDGQPHTQTEAVPVHVWEMVERGSSVDIEYVAGDATTSRVPPESTEEATVALIMLAIGVLLFLIGAAVAVTVFRRRQPVARPGIAAEGNEAPEPPRLRDASGLGRNRSAWQLMRSSFGFLFGGIFLVCGLPFLVLGLYFFYNDWRFAQEARTTEGIVLTKDIRITSSGSGSRRTRTRHYELTYRFTVGGETFEGEDELSRGDWLRLRERESIDILYRPDRPSSNALAQGSDWALKAIFTLLGGIFTAIGGVVFLRSARSARRESHLRRHGARTEGTIVALHARNVRINNVQQWRLRYVYQDHQGQRREGTHDLPESEAGEWSVGATGAVLYDPAKPGNAAWLGRNG